MKNLMIGIYEQTNWEQMKRLLTQARKALAITDAELVEKAVSHSKREARKYGTTPDKVGNIHLTENMRVWSFYSFLEHNEFELAWDELNWACDRLEAMIKSEGDIRRFKENRPKFWQFMALAARLMMNLDTPAEVKVEKRRSAR